MLREDPRDLIERPRESAPLLLVIIDTEEEFDWSRPLSRDNTSVTSIAAQPRAHDLFAKYGIVPTYVIDYPVATSDLAIRTLGELAAGGACEIGAHLHPWVNPPDTEDVTPHNSYPGNLPAALEREKLAHLTSAIVDNYGLRPTVYKAGRYGVGPHTAETLADLGYTVDVSVVPYTSFTDDGGPDFRSVGFLPYWCDGPGGLLEIPLTCGFHDLFSAWGRRLFPLLASPTGMTVHAPGVFARSGLLERIRLSPERGRTTRPTAVSPTAFSPRAAGSSRSPTTARRWRQATRPTYATMTSWRGSWRQWTAILRTS